MLLSDFSKNSWQAIVYATSLLEQFPCNFFVLNVYNVEHFGLRGQYTLDPDRSLDGLAERQSLEGLGEILTKVTFELSNPRHHFYVLSRPEPLLGAVNALVEELDIELIVMGARGIQPQGITTYGHNAHTLIHKFNKCPILVVPAACTPISGRDILTYAGHSVGSQSDQVQLLAEIASVHKANIHICTPKARSRFKDSVKRQHIKLRRLLSEVNHSFLNPRNTPVFDAGTDSVKRNSWAMISIFIPIPRFWSYGGWAPSLRKQLLAVGSCPLLVLHE